jgi:AcrR family transcriptional regulator
MVSKAPGQLLDAVTSVAARSGYSGLTVESVHAEAGVGRATFYQYFSSVEDCFWSAYRHHAEQLIADVRRALRGAANRREALLDVLVDLALSRPEVARALFSQGLGAGAAGVLARDALLSQLERVAADSQRASRVFDLPDPILIGATARFLAMRISAEEATEGLRSEVHNWAEGFLRAPDQRRWSIELVPALPRFGSRSPRRLSSPQLEGSARERIINATAATVCERGYGASTVAQIATAARVSRRSFYNEFAGKADAFIAAYEHGFQMTLTAAAPAFFSASEWPERVWCSALAFTRQLEREPAFAHLGFVECYALGPSFESRVHEMQLAFTLFLEDGHRQNGAASASSQARSALTAAAIAEAGFQVASRSPGLYIRSMQPLAVYVALSSVIGSDAAGQFVAAKLASQGPISANGSSNGLHVQS